MNSKNGKGSKFGFAHDQKNEGHRLVKRFISIGPSLDCNCPVCIFTQSQAPGQPYDLSKCPKYSSLSPENKIVIQEIDQKTP